MARINFHDAYEMIDMRHSSPTTATFIRAGDGRSTPRDAFTDPAVDTSPTAGSSSHAAGAVLQEISSNREPSGDPLRIPG